MTDQPDYNDLIVLLDWCRAFFRRTGDDVRMQFLVGVYQLSQAHDWTAPEAKAQSYAAAAIHFCTVAEQCEIPLEQHLSFGRSEFPCDLRALRTTPVTDAGVLYYIGRISQMLIYRDSSTNRRARFSPETLGNFLAKLVEACFSRVPPDDRFGLISTEIAEIGTVV